MSSSLSINSFFSGAVFFLLRRGLKVKLALSMLLDVSVDVRGFA